MSHLPRRWSPRVYYNIATLIVVVLWTGAVTAQVELTVTPSMVKGAPGAPVTIVEFADYQ